MEKSNKKILFICIIILLIVCILICILYKSFNKSEFNQKCDELEKRFIMNQNTFGKVSDLIKLDFDYVYSFEPYKSIESMISEIGFYSKYLKETHSEGTFNLVFVKDKEVVCVLSGNGEKWYYI